MSERERRRQERMDWLGRVSFWCVWMVVLMMGGGALLYVMMTIAIK